MDDHTDFIEFDRHDGIKVRIVFEMYRTEILFYHYEYKHDENSEWKSMDGKQHSQAFTYIAKSMDGEKELHTIEFPTENELKTAQEIISQRYYFWSI